ncbi:hypothetical protein ACNJPA_26030, partial [Escherichia coli]|uniref:hypothetical protein n=1 Tax=Escherichia coli TaxID=562 RepID=UPI003A87FB43
LWQFSRSGFLVHMPEISLRKSDLPALFRYLATSQNIADWGDILGNVPFGPVTRLRCEVMRLHRLDEFSALLGQFMKDLSYSGWFDLVYGVIMLIWAKFVGVCLVGISGQISVFEWGAGKSLPVK